MNFDEAISMHTQWKTKLRALLNGQGTVDATTLSTDNACVLGKWIYEEGASHASHAEFRALKDAHAKFHRIAGAVAHKAQTDREAARKQLDSPEYQAASTATVSAITTLKKVIGK